MKPQPGRLPPSLCAVLVDHDARQRVNSAFPGPGRESLAGMIVASLPAALDARTREVDVLGVIFAVEPGRQEPNEMHESTTTVLGEIANDGVVAQLVRQAAGEFTHDVAKAMDLSLAGDMARHQLAERAFRALR